MKFTRLFIVFGFAMGILSCGSEERDVQVRSLNASYALPPEILGLDAFQMNPEMSLFEDVEGSRGIEFMPAIQMASVENSEFLSVSVSELPAGRYRGILEFTVETEGRRLVLARANIPLEIVFGQVQVLLHVLPGDFSVDLDDDGDGLSNLAEYQGPTSPFVADTDGDSVPDGLDIFPSMSGESSDSDGDGVGDNADNCRFLENPGQENFEEDGIGDACDPDDDNDGFKDDKELEVGSDPFNPDTDRDGIKDGGDNCVLQRNASQQNSDGDSSGDECDPDDDNDGILDLSDNCPFLASQNLTDTDRNGAGDVCTNDDDGDGRIDQEDNCRTIFNPSQIDTDSDGFGNTCDADDDNDGLSDLEENSAGEDSLLTNPLSDDTDDDGIFDSIDNCRITENPDQAAGRDTDDDGDACDCDDLDDSITTANAVFVSSSGSDLNSGARNAPVRTISHAIEVAKEIGKQDVYVTAGVYDERVRVASGINLIGGFALSGDGTVCLRALYDQARDIAINETRITTSLTETISFENIEQPTVLDGFIIENTSPAVLGTSVVKILASAPITEGRITLRNNQIRASNPPSVRSRAIFIENASPTLVNNLIQGGDSRESIGIELVGSPATRIIHNTINAGNSVSASFGIVISGSAPTLVNNIIFTQAALDQRVLFVRGNSLSSAAVVRRNILFGLQSEESLDRPLIYMDLSPSMNQIQNVSEFDLLDGIGGNQDENLTNTSDGTEGGTLFSLEDLFRSPQAEDGRILPGSLPVDRGLNPATIVSLPVLKDKDLNLRPNGSAHDIGAYELP